MRPLTGTVVLDFGQGVAGPYCGMLLADFGADVIKVEPPRGDWSRSMGAQLTPTESATYLSVNRNKRSIVLDLSKAGAREIARRLIERCDVVVESFRPGIMDKFGLGYDQLAATRPELIYCSVTGFGADGPYAQMPAGDSTMQALGGLMSIIGEADGPPLRVGNVVSDMLAGMHAFEGVLLALMDRARHGNGRRVDVSLMNVLIAFQAPTLVEYLATGNIPRRNGNDHPMIAPSGAVRTSDGALVLTVLSHQWDRFCRGVGLDNLIDDARFATNSDRIAHRAELMAALEQVFLGKTSAAWIEQLRRNDILCAPINDYAAVVADPQVQHSRIVNQLAHPILGTVPTIANPVRARGAELPPARTPPVLGQDTFDVLTNVLGLDEGEIDRLIAAGEAMGSERSAGAKT